VRRSSTQSIWRTGFCLFAERLVQSLANIHKRLGGERYQRLQG
jgi:tRNA 2-selenouridine synthase